MAKVQAQVVGGEIKAHEANTVGELMSKLNLTNYKAQVNGEEVDNDYELSDYEFVSFSQKVKGARGTIKTYKFVMLGGKAFPQIRGA